MLLKGFTLTKHRGSYEDYAEILLAVSENEEDLNHKKLQLEIEYDQFCKNYKIYKKELSDYENLYRSFMTERIWNSPNREELFQNWLQENPVSKSIREFIHIH